MSTRAGYQPVDTGTYYGEINTWEAGAYIVQSGDNPIIGRIYITLRDNQLYAFRFESPEDKATDNYFDIFFPMLNGFVAGN